MLRGTWTASPVSIGMPINVYFHSTVDKDGSCIVVDDENGLVILQPDVLVSGTRLSDSFRCLRRSVLEERIKVCRSSGRFLRC